MMRIGVLGRGGANWTGGLQHAFNLVRAIRSLPKKEHPDLWLLVSKEDGTAPFLDVARMVKLCRVPKRKPDLSAAGVDAGLAHVVAEKSLDVVFPCVRSLGGDFPGRWLAWVLDLQHRCHPQFFSESERERRDEEFRRIAADAHRVILSSECALADFNRAYRGFKKKLHVLRLATVPLPQWFEDDPARTAGRYALPPRYFMFPGHCWVHKNHRVAFEAMKLVVNRGLDIHLVCTGKSEDPRRPEHGQRLRWFVREHRLGDRIHFLGLVPRLDEIHLLRAATAVVQPSLFEGLSTVVEDARALGKRMLLSDIPIHREQDPEEAVYFDPFRPDLLAGEMVKAWELLPAGPCTEDEMNARVVQARRVRRYAREFLKLARELVRSGRRHR